MNARGKYWRLNDLRVIAACCIGAMAVCAMLGCRRQQRPRATTRPVPVNNQKRSRIPNPTPWEVWGWIRRVGFTPKFTELGLQDQLTLEHYRFSSECVFALVSMVDTGLDSRISLVVYDPEFSKGIRQQQFSVFTDGREQLLHLLVVQRHKMPQNVHGRIRRIPMDPPSDVALVCLATPPGLREADEITIVVRAPDDPANSDRVVLTERAKFWKKAAASPAKPWGSADEGMTTEEKQRLTRERAKRQMGLAPKNVWLAARALLSLECKELSVDFRLKLLDELEQMEDASRVLSPFIRETLLKQAKGQGK